MLKSSSVRVTAGKFLKIEAETLPKLMFPSMYLAAYELTMPVTMDVDNNISRISVHPTQMPATHATTFEIRLVLFGSISCNILQIYEKSLKSVFFDKNA